MEPLSRMLKLYHPTLEIEPAQKDRFEAYIRGVVFVQYYNFEFSSDAIITGTQLNLTVSRSTVKYNI